VHTQAAAGSGEEPVLATRRERGFTLVELMIVVVIIGILASVGIPNFLSAQARAREGSTKANMHTFQLAAEDYNVQNNGAYATLADGVAGLLDSYGSQFKNPFDNSTGTGNAWADQASWTTPLATGVSKPGLVAYGDSVTLTYQIAGRGQKSDLRLVLSPGSQ
jgi:prepilin-type N-terminal cleavage/methylation domain-containing protein